MNRQDIAIIINTCPKYFYLLDACFGLIRRYAEGCGWPLYLATEEPEHEVVKTVCKRHQVSCISLDTNESDFLESRAAAVRKLPPSVRYILPLQEDFLLERFIDQSALGNALEILDADRQVQSIRLMPCPGSSAREGFWGEWRKLLPDDLLFSYQATIWRRDTYQRFMDGLIQQGRSMHPDMTKAQWNQYCISVNPAETHSGIFLLKQQNREGIHLCWPRKATWANAVYWSPWPYRPTAVVKGVLQSWAEELIRREGFILRSTSQGSF